jgi:hypothetical protein
MADIKTITQGVTRSVNATEARIALFVRDLKQLFDDRLDEILGGVLAGDPTEMEVAAVLGGLKQAMIEAGLEDQLGDIQAIYSGELRQIAQEMKLSAGADVTYSDTDRTVVESLISFDTTAISGSLDTYGAKLSSSIMRSVIGGETPDLQDLQDTIGGSTFRNIETDLNTAMMGFNRQVTQTKAQELGLNLFIYLGPDDRITRPFCHKLLSKSPPIYTSDEIAGMDNGQGLPVAIYGGGYNCRHQWRAVTEERAKELGYEG